MEEQLVRASGGSFGASAQKPNRKGEVASETMILTKAMRKQFHDSIQRHQQQSRTSVNTKPYLLHERYTLFHCWCYKS